MLGCRGEMLTIDSTEPPPPPAAESGRAGSVPKAEAVMASGGTPAPAWVNTAAAAGAGGSYEGMAASVAGGMAGASGAAGSLAEAAAGSGGRPRRRAGGAGAAEGGGGMAGGQTVARAGSGGRKSEAGAAAANGCTQNLACQLDVLPSTGDVHQDCVDRINQFREECACLPALERWVEGEACADEMAKYDSGGTEAHAGFGDKICNGGSAQNECPGWRSEAQVVSVCLQKMWDEGPPPISDCSGSCFQMYGHFLNMTNQRMAKVACGFHKTDEGQIWSVQNFSR